MTYKIITQDEAEPGAYLNARAFFEAQLFAYVERYGQNRPDVSVHSRIGDFRLASHVAMRVDMILRELVANAFKHAFPQDEGGEVYIELDEHADGRASLVLQHAGRNVKNPENLGKRKGRGMRFVRGLADEMGATFKTLNAGGLTFYLGFNPLMDAPRPQDAAEAVYA